jgi:predicted kinase
MTARTYDAMLERTAAALSGGRPVIADATFATRAVRAPFIDLARARSAPLAVVHLTAPPEVIQDRMAARARDPAEVSDADLAVHEAARDRFEPPEETPPERTIRSGPVAAPESLVQRVLDALLA